MSYVEEFCENIAIINQGTVVLDGMLDDIKKEFGNGQLIINADNMEPEQLSGRLGEKFGSVLEITAVTREGCVVKRRDTVTSRDILRRLLDTDIELDRFENYKPSLNDIFVAKAGDEA